MAPFNSRQYGLHTRLISRESAFSRSRGFRCFNTVALSFIPHQGQQPCNQFISINQECNGELGDQSLVDERSILPTYHIWDQLRASRYEIKELRNMRSTEYHSSKNKQKIPSHQHSAVASLYAMVKNPQHAAQLPPLCLTSPYIPESSESGKVVLKQYAVALDGGGTAWIIDAVLKAGLFDKAFRKKEDVVIGRSYIKPNEDTHVVELTLAELERAVGSFSDYLKLDAQTPHASLKPLSSVSDTCPFVVPRTMLLRLWQNLQSGVHGNFGNILLWKSSSNPDTEGHDVKAVVLEGNQSGGSSLGDRKPLRLPSLQPQASTRKTHPHQSV